MFMCRPAGRGRGGLMDMRLPDARIPGALSFTTCCLLNHAQRKHPVPCTSLRAYFTWERTIL